MTTMTINPENWVETSTEITIKGNTVEVNGETLELVWNAPILEDNIRWDYHSIEVRWDGRKFCTLGRFGDDTNWECFGTGIYREHKNPFALAAIMASNLI